MQDNKSTVVQAMTAELKASLSSAVSAEMQAVRGEVKSITSAIETSQEFLSSKFDSIASEFKELKIENAYLKNELSDLKHSHSALTQTVYRLEEVVDKTNKAGMLNNAVLLGVPTQMNENVNELAIKTVGEMGLNLPDGSILSASRMSANAKIPNAKIPIRIVFKDKEIKELVFSKKREKGNLLSTCVGPSLLFDGKPTNLHIRDELSPLSLELLKEMRVSQELLKIKYVWPGRGGVVLVKKEDGAKLEKIRNRYELSGLIARYTHQPKKVLSPSSPSPKRKKGDEKRQ